MLAGFNLKNQDLKYFILHKFNGFILIVDPFLLLAFLEKGVKLLMTKLIKLNWLNCTNSFIIFISFIDVQ